MIRFDPPKFAPLLVACLTACGPASAPPRQVLGATSEQTHASGEPVAPEQVAGRAAAGILHEASGPLPAPEQIAAMVEVSATALRAGDRRTAERSLQPCLHRDPPVLACELQLARFLVTVPRRKEQYQAAMGGLVIVDDPAISTADYDELAQQLRLLGDLPQSEAAARVALSRSPTAARHMVHANILQGLPERLDDAIAALKNALELAPERRDWTLELATLSSRHPAHVDDAIAIFESLRRESGDEEFRRTLADRVAELRRAAADSSDAAAPPPPMDRRKNHPTPPAPDGGSTSR